MPTSQTIRQNYNGSQGSKTKKGHPKKVFPPLKQKILAQEAAVKQAKAARSKLRSSVNENGTNLTPPPTCKGRSIPSGLPSRVTRSSHTVLHSSLWTKGTVKEKGTIKF